MMSASEAPALSAAISDLYAAYADALNERDLDRWLTFFTDDCVYRITTRENHERGLPLSLLSCESRAGLRDRVMAIRRTLVFRPRLVRSIASPPWIAGSGDAGDTLVRSSFAAFETIEGEATRGFASGASYDRVVRERGNPRFRERVCVLDSSLVQGSLIYPL